MGYGSLTSSLCTIDNRWALCVLGDSFFVRRDDLAVGDPA